LIGGARMVKYFTLGDAGAWNYGGLVQGNFWDTPYNGDSISNQDQVSATNAQVLSLASVLNSPNAVGYCSVSPAPVRLTSSVADSGFEIMVKYHTRGSAANSKFYIFAIPRWGEGTTNQTATFTIANTGATQVTVIDEGRTISITGGTTFSDTFANSNTVHIYRVD
jgi:hypothetical protein